MPDADMREKILIVDDNRQNIEMLMNLFKDDYRIAAAVDAKRALKVARSESPPDIILSDILMPEMNGYELCSALKQDESTKNIPLVFVTAVSEVMDETRGFALGAVDYITKPFHPPMVKARVAMHLNLKRKQELLEKFAFIDALTEIPNRRRLDEVLEQEWKRAQRSNQPLSVLFMDVDDFKPFNDTYGHGKGDDVLRRVARAITECLRRAGDFVARFGGEEFVAVLPYQDKAKAAETAKLISEAVEGLGIEHESSGVSDHVTISVGVATAQPTSGVDAKRILEEADKALYEAKSLGKRCIHGVEV